MKSNKLWIATLVMLLSAAAASAQQQQSFLEEPGIPAFTTGFPVEHGLINLANGSLHLEIPIAAYTQRGDRLQYRALLVYDSRFWTYDPNWMDDNLLFAWNPDGVSGYPQPLGVGWRLITGGESGEPSMTSELFIQCTYNNQTMYKTKYSKYRYQEPNGTVHRFPITLWQLNPNCAGTGNGTASALASDNSGFRMDVTNFAASAVYAPDGTKVFPAVQDTNGNFFTQSFQQVTGVGFIQHVVDTLGREPVIASFSGNQVLLDYLNPQGTRSRVTVTTAPINLATSFGTAGDYTGTLQEIQSIAFPDGSSYQFQYDSYGQITSMTLPTGGQVTYGYTNTTATTASQINRWLTSRTLDGNTWTFTPTFSCSTASCTGAGDGLHVTVITPPYSDGAITASDNHVYSFFFAFPNGGGGAWPSQVQYFRGAASGTPVLTLTKEYNNGQNNSCQLPMGNALTPVLIRETLIWPSSSGTLNKKAEYCYDTNGVNQITKKMWDYQPNGNFAAAPDREVDASYVTDPNYVNANILTLPLTATTLGPGSAQMAQTTYGYDAGNPQPGSISTQHTTPTGPRANQTSVNKWLNTTGGSVTNSTVWFDTGEVSQSIDPLNNASSFTYDVSLAGAYPTKTCNPLNQCSYKSYDFNTGVVTSSTDENGSGPGDPAHTTTYTYDSMLRQLCTNLPSGGQTCAGYPDPNHVTQQKKVTASLTDAWTTVFDDVGRRSETQHSLSNGIAKVDTTYDPVGAIATVTNPYFSTADSTYGVVQSLHDALGRKVKTIQQDGSFTTIAYGTSSSGGVNGFCQTGTDEAGKQRTACFNGFGQTIEVLEAGDPFAGTVASGGLTINGTLQSKSATSGTPGTGSVTIGGIGEQSKSGVGATPANPGSGNVTVGGTEGYVIYDPCFPIDGTSCPTADYDYGYVYVTVTPVPLAPAVGAIPPGSYQLTCINVSVDGSGNLNAQCEKTDSTWQQSPTLYYMNCALDIRNVNGVLTCLTAGAIPPGSYQLTCTNISVDGNGNLNAQCEKINGTWQQSPPLYYLDCEGEITNQNGLLTCSHGITDSTPYGQGSDATSVANGLVAAINGDFASFVRASALNGVLTLTARYPGKATNFNWKLYAVSTDSTGNFDPNGSFANPLSSGALGNGADANPGTTVYDSGSCTVKINGTPYSQPFGQGDNTSSIAFGLASNISAGSLAKASVSGATISITADATGTGSDYTLSGGNCSYNSTYFSGASFVVNTPAGLTNGTDGSPAATDAGTVQMSVGGYNATANYGNGTGQDGTAAAVASDLVGKIQAQLPTSNPLFTISASGASININWGSVGVAGNVTVTTASTTTQTANFATPSFASCSITTNPQNCSTTLSGGQDPYASGVAHPYVTLYTYDGLGNLTCVEQHGDATSGTGCSASPASDATSPWRIRRFAYDSLSRMVTSSSPESNTAIVNGTPARVNTSYVYDAAGNILQKTGPAPNQSGTATQTLSYCYDALNRQTGKAYSAQTCTNGQLPSGTAVVSYFYDQGGAAANAIGHMTSLNDQAGSASYAYDIMGRVSTEQRTLNGIPKSMGYSYNLDGSLKTLTYPSGAVVSYAPDSGGRPVSAIDTANGINYVDGATYTPGGDLAGFISGNSGSFAGVTNTFIYNPRLQLCRTTASSTGAVPTSCSNSLGNLLDLEYRYNLASGNNDNVTQIINYRDQTRNQTFTYDALNRLASAQNAGTDCTQGTVNGKTKFWGNTYGYDAWGNLLAKTITKCQPESLDRKADAQNRLHVKVRADYQYDTAGNLTYDTTGLTYTYDAENRMTGATGYAYTYDAAGNRVEKSSGVTGTLYWYMSVGIVAEGDLNGNLRSEYVFFQGKRVARRDFSGGAVSYYFSDRLGTTNVITDAQGNTKNDSDFYPWGGQLEFVNNDPNHYWYTGKERDGETQLDYFGARYYGSGFARFTSADPIPIEFNRVLTPQELNLYVYAGNNPLRWVDLDGREKIAQSLVQTIVNFNDIYVPRAQQQAWSDPRLQLDDNGLLNYDIVVMAIWGESAAGIMGSLRAWADSATADEIGAAESALSHAVDQDDLTQFEKFAGQLEKILGFIPTGRAASASGFVHNVVTIASYWNYNIGLPNRRDISTRAMKYLQSLIYYDYGTGTLKKKTDPCPNGDCKHGLTPPGPPVLVPRPPRPKMDRDQQTGVCDVSGDSCKEKS